MKIIIAGGGTGGHLFPGIAIAEEFLKRGEADVLFVGAGRSLEKDVLCRLGFSFRTIPIEGFRGRGAVGLMNVLLKLPGS
ncbi:MAG: glycosyltransferase, partial [Syntrophales bacterium]|nr:glycosyltransferase [Syntrophales bacterium]